MLHASMLSFGPERSLPGAVLILALAFLAWADTAPAADNASRPEVAAEFRLQGPAGLNVTARLAGNLSQTQAGELGVTARLLQGRLDGPWLSGPAFGDADILIGPHGKVVGAVSLDLDAPRLLLGQTPLNLKRLLLSFADGLVHPDGGFELRGLRIAAPPMAHCRGEASRKGPQAALDLDCSLDQPRRLQTLLAPLLGPEFPRLSLPPHFPLRVQARWDESGGGLRLTVHSPDPFTLDPLPLGPVSVPPFTADLMLQPAGHPGGPNRANGTLAFHGPASLAGHVLDSPRLRFQATTDGEAARFSKLELSMAPGSISYADKTLGSGAVLLHGDMDFQPDGLVLGDFALLTDRAGSWKVRLRAPPQEELTLRIEAGRTPAAEAARLLDIYTDADLEAFQATGTVSARALYTQGGSSQSVSGSLRTRNLAFSSPDGSLLSDHLNATLRLEGVFPDHGPAAIDASLEVPSGELLYESTYVTFDKHPLQVSGHLSGADPTRPRAVRLNATMDGLAAVGARARAEPRLGRFGWGASLKLPWAELAPAYETFVKGPLGMSHPLLATSSLNGTARGEISGQGNASFADLHGRVQTLSAGYKLADPNLTMDGLELELPFAYRVGASPTDPVLPPIDDHPGWGRLTIASLQAFGVKKTSASFPVKLAPNRLQIGRSLEIPLLGGSLAIAPLRIRSPFGDGFRAETGLRLKDLDLSRLNAGDIPVQGLVGGRLPRVILTRDALTADGVLRGTLFGGELGVSNLHVDKPLAADRKPGMNVTVRRMHLGELSAALGVGRVTGRLDLDVNGLEIAYGQPVGFDVTARSVEAPGVSQRISLAAVNSISVLGTGSGLGDVGAGVMAAFLDDLPYARIGLTCQLKNDVFTVQGLMHDDNVQYIVKRPLLFGVNVVNSNPNNRIRFSDMLNRLERVLGRSRDNPQGEE